MIRSLSASLFGLKMQGELNIQKWIAEIRFYVSGKKQMMKIWSIEYESFGLKTYQKQLQHMKRHCAADALSVTGTAGKA